MNKPKDMEEFDGYIIPEPRQISEEERLRLIKKLEENRKKILEDNHMTKPAQQ